MHLLNWKPALDFEELIKFTVDGYSIESTKKNIYDERVKQISDYVELARQRNIVWTKTNSNTESLREGTENH